MTEGRLIVEGRANWAYTYWLKDHGSIRIGRGPLNDLQLADNAVSTLHAEITHDGERYVLRDLRSSNGTFVNGKKIETQTLQDGDQIRLGQCLMSFLDRVHKTGAERVQPGIPYQADHFSAEGTKLDTVFQRMKELNRSLEEKHEQGSVAGATDEIKRFSEELGEAQKELKRAQEELESITLQNSLFRMLQSDAPENKRLNMALAFISNQVLAENGFIMQIDPDTRKWVVRARFGGISDWSPGEGERPLSLTVVEKVIKSGEAIFSEKLVTDARMSSAMSVARLDIQSTACLPLKKGKNVIGVLYVDRRINPEPFPEKVQRQAKIFADVLSENIHGS